MLRTICVVALAFFGFSVCSFGADKPGSKNEKIDKGATEKGTTEKDSKVKHTYAVIKVGDDMKVVQSDKIAEIKKDAEKEAKEAAKTAKGKKVEAKKVIVLKDKFATEKEAQKFLDDQLEKAKKVDKTDKTAKDTKHKA
jgi:hypothetical protein